MSRHKVDKAKKIMGESYQKNHSTKVR